MAGKCQARIPTAMDGTVYGPMTFAVCAPGTAPDAGLERAHQCPVSDYCSYPRWRSSPSSP